MKIAIPATGIALVLLGIVWILQGTNILPGSFMTGQPFWTWMGILAFVVGATLLYTGLRRRSRI